MINKQIDIRFEGEKFLPSILMEKTKWPLNILVEAGQISPKGKFKGMPSPYGIAFLKIDMDLNTYDPIEIIEKYSDILIKHKSKLKDSGVEEIIFDIETLNSKEYNYSFDPEIINKLNQLNARIDFHGNDLEIALDTWINNFYHNSYKHLNRDEASKFNIIRNKIIHSPNIHVFNISHIYDFIIFYMIKYMGNHEKDIPSFESSYLEYSNSNNNGSNY